MMGDDAVVGRQAELGRLTRWLDDLDGSGGRVVLIRGEAGIGKSTLVEAFVAKASPRVRVFLGMCDPLGTPQPLGPVRDVARRSASVAAALDVGDRRAVMDALLDLLSHPTQAAVLVIEDVQWADEATFDVVRFLGRRIAAANGLLVLTYRDNEVGDGHPMRQIVGELPPANVARIAVPPLSLDAIASLAGDVPVEPSELLAFTGGNALFVSEVVAAGALEAPAAVEDAVLASVSRLPPDARRVAEFVSVNPAGVEWPVVDALLGPVTSELHAGVGRGLLRVDDDVRYRHEIQRRAVEASLSAHRRRELHQRVLAQLDGRADVARLVHHARAAGDDDALMRFAPQAARAAMAAGSHREAIAHFRAIGPLLHRLPDKEAASLAEDWVRTAHRFGYPDDAVAVLPRAVARWRSAGNREALARTLALGVMVLEDDARHGKAEAAAAEAIEILEELPAGSTLAYALTERARLHHLRGGGNEAQAIAALDRAIGIAEAAGDDRSAADALTLKGSRCTTRRTPTASHSSSGRMHAPRVADTGTRRPMRCWRWRARPPTCVTCTERSIWSSVPAPRPRATSCAHTRSTHGSCAPRCCCGPVTGCRRRTGPPRCSACGRTQTRSRRASSQRSQPDGEQPLPTRRSGRRGSWRSSGTSCTSSIPRPASWPSTCG